MLGSMFPDSPSASPQRIYLVDMEAKQVSHDLAHGRAPWSPSYIINLDNCDYINQNVLPLGVHSRFR